MYNGCKNYQTWNVKLWIANDEGLYNFARECSSYDDFVDSLKDLNSEIGYQTPDNVAWNDSGIDDEEMVEFWNENFLQVEA
jgi:cupin superfamily acireductone dioxygenase involved in methionine salvage